MRAGKVLALATIGLSLFAAPAAGAGAFPSITETAGVWTNVFKSVEGASERWNGYVDVAPSAVQRKGDLVRAREAVIYLKPRTAEGLTYQVLIQEGEFDCAAKTVRWLAIAEVNFEARAIYKGANPPQETGHPVSPGTFEYRTMEQVCAGAGIGRHDTYIFPQAALAAMSIRYGTDHDNDPAPPAPQGVWESNLPPAKGDWRPVDEEFTHVQLIDTSSIVRHGSSVRFWVAVVDNTGDERPSATVVSLAQIEVDCANGSNTFIELSHRDAHGVTTSVVDAAGASQPGAYGLFDHADGDLGIAAACHSQRMAGLERFDTPESYRAKRGPKKGS
jgi:hypothetical protein